MAGCVLHGQECPLLAEMRWRNPGGEEADGRARELKLATLHAMNTVEADLT
jgi:hypothetical protein